MQSIERKIYLIPLSLLVWVLYMQLLLLHTDYTPIIYVKFFYPILGVWLKSLDFFITFSASALICTGLAKAFRSDFSIIDVATISIPSSLFVLNVSLCETFGLQELLIIIATPLIIYSLLKFVKFPPFIGALYPTPPPKLFDLLVSAFTSIMLSILIFFCYGQWREGVFLNFTQCVFFVYIGFSIFTRIKRHIFFRSIWGLYTIWLSGIMLISWPKLKPLISAGFNCA